MTNHNIHHSTISRRNLLKAGAVSGAAFLAGQHQSHHIAAQDLVGSSPAELLDMIQQTEDSELGIDALTEVFARSGIVVFDEQGVTQLTSPATPVSALAFMQWQLTPMVAELAAGISRPASEYDAMFPTETEDGDAVPTVGELIAGYYDAGDTPGSEFTRAYLDQFVSDDLLIEAGDLPAPQRSLRYWVERSWPSCRSKRSCWATGQTSRCHELRITALR